MSDLLTMVREHDLPPRWDGKDVTWGDWQGPLPVFICPPPSLADTCCKACGSIGHNVHNRGYIEQLLALYAFRCTDCKHDQVLEIETNELWDLDHTDYGADGSTPPADTPPSEPAKAGRKVVDHKAGADAARAAITEGGLW